MSKNYYELYIASVLSLAETLVIKSSATADSINAVLIQIYGNSSVDPYDKTTWKYYKNICGQYHSTDSPIEIVSLDTLQTITFNIENLTINTATKKAYQYGTRNYNELVSLHPNMEMLILGILYPADMDKAVNSDDGTILSYPPVYVESNEVNLIGNLEKWVKNFDIRWHNQQFGISDDLYETTYLGLLYLNLVPAILNLRLRACKTSEAHSFHIRQYLASHGMLDSYLDDMTKKQALFLYRNINYIERNNGKRNIFQWLVEHIMTQRNLPLAELVMKHDTSVMPDSLYADIHFKRKDINNSFNSINKEQYTLDELLTKEYPLAIDNKSYTNENIGKIDRLFKNSLSSVVATKVLESSVIDYSDSTPYTFYDVAINHWLALAANDTYNTYIRFKNPINGQLINMHCKDAFIYMTYASAKLMGANVVNIPKLFAQRVIRQPKATISDLMEVADTKYIKPIDAYDIVSYIPIISRCVSVDAFYELTTEIFNCAQYHRRFVANQQHYFRRGLIDNMVSRVYCDKVCQVVPDNTTFENWLISKNLPTDTLTNEQYIAIVVELFETTTGGSIDSTKAMRQLQSAMIGLMTQLSSYSIQYIAEVNGSNIKLTSGSIIRIGDVDTSAEGVAFALDRYTDVVGLQAYENLIIAYESRPAYTNLINTQVMTVGSNFDIIVKPRITINGNIEDIRINQTGIDSRVSYLNGDAVTGIIGDDYYNTLTDAEIALMKDIYCDCKMPTPVGIDIATVILIDTIQGFTPIGAAEGVLAGFNTTVNPDVLPALIPVGGDVVLNAFENNVSNIVLNGFTLG